MLRKLYIIILAFLVISACNTNRPVGSPVPIQASTTAQTQAMLEQIVTPTQKAPRQLTVCMPREPQSLFLYGTTSQAARAVWQAIYDGPLDWANFEFVPVLLQDSPSVSNGAVSQQALQVMPNDLIIDSVGNLVNLIEGVSYLPAGCNALGCAQVYRGGETVSMDQLVVQFKLRPGLSWADGSPLTADDSLYSYEVARALAPRAQTELLARTQSYQVLDETTLEWRGLPGLLDPLYPANLFNPLPRQAYQGIKASQLLTDTLATRTPPAYGAYQIQEWQAGDQIILKRNPAYFRVAEKLPAFDTLVFRFVPDPAQALADLRSGACDLLDSSYGLTPADLELQGLQDAGEVALVQVPNTAWEHLDFGINSLSVDPTRPNFFQSKEVRQAVAQCVDRQAIVAELTPGQAVLDSYLQPEHPLANPEIRRYAFDPQAANALLELAGWIDSDNDPLTPRLAAGVAGVSDGAPFTLSLLAGDSAEQVRLAQLIQESLAQCGIQIQIDSRPAQEAFAPGPDGPVFGRNFSLAQFAWPFDQQPSCSLFMTSHIPGPYPDYPLGWAGANAAGYSNPQFDQACQQALNTLFGSPEQRQAHTLAQAIFTEELPVLPLFTRSAWVVTRPDFCGLVADPSNPDIYRNLENFDYGEACRQNGG